MVTICSVEYGALDCCPSRNVVSVIQISFGILCGTIRSLKGIIGTSEYGNILRKTFGFSTLSRIYICSSISKRLFFSFIVTGRFKNTESFLLIMCSLLCFYNQENVFLCISIIVYNLIISVNLFQNLLIFC